MRQVGRFLLGLALFGMANCGTSSQGDGQQTEAQRVLGVAVVTEDAAPGGHGVKVVIVLPGTAAESAGIAVGDVLLSLDGEPLDAKGDIQRIVAGRPDGAIMAVHLLRGGKPLDLATQL